MAEIMRLCANYSKPEQAPKSSDHGLGKAEVVSSILTGSTIASPARQGPSVAGELTFLAEHRLSRLGGEQIRQLAMAFSRLGRDRPRRPALLFGGPSGIITLI